MSDVVNNSNIDCLQGNMTCHIARTEGEGDICRIALKAVNITLLLPILSVESQKGIITIQGCSVESLRALLLYKVYGNRALLVLNGTSLNGIN